MQHRPTSPSWQKDANGTWWRAATEHDTKTVYMDAASNDGVVLAGTPEEADRIDDEARNRRTSNDLINAWARIIVEQKRFLPVLALVLCSIVFVGALDDVPHSRAAVVEAAR